MNIERGFRKSLLLGTTGFLVPVAVLGSVAACVFAFAGTHPMDRQQDIQRLPSMILTPAVGCGIVFALAAFASYTPDSGVNFIRSLLMIGSAVVLAILVTQPHTQYKMPDPNAWIELVVPLVTAVIVSAAILAIGLSKRDPDHANAQTSNE